MVGFLIQMHYFNLDKGEFGTVKSQVQDYSFISYPNEWYRINITYTSNATQVRIYNVDGDNNLTSTPNGTDGIYIYGAQNEAGSYATSLIHTSGSTVTRSADAANNAGNSDLINSTEGVLYAEIKPVKDTTNFNLISLSDGTTANIITIGARDNNTQLFIGYRVSNSYQALFEPNANYEEFQKIALSYKVNEFKAYINGTQVGIDTSGSVLSANTLTQFQFAFGNTTTYRFLGNAKSVMVFKEALTDLELEKLTGYNNHELYMNYYNRLSYLGLAEEYNVESDINNYIL